MSQSDEQRIAREEAFWTTPKLLAMGFSFLGACIVIIYLMSYVPGCN